MALNEEIGTETPSKISNLPELLTQQRPSMELQASFWA
jgi:hypothetical protein